MTFTNCYQSGCGCEKDLDFIDKINSKHNAANHTYSCIKKISCTVCGTISKIIRENISCGTECPFRVDSAETGNQTPKGEEWFITEAKFKWIVNIAKILPKIRTISKIECEDHFSLFFNNSNSEFASYPDFALSVSHCGMYILYPGNMSFEKKNSKSKVLSLFKQTIPEFKLTHLDSSLENIEIEAKEGNEVVITYTKIFYKKDEKIYEVQVLGA
jgi:hypothetical protein